MTGDAEGPERSVPEAITLDLEDVCVIDVVKQIDRDAMFEQPKLEPAKLGHFHLDVDEVRVIVIP